MPESNVIAEQARRIVESGALGRSRSYVRLLEYLVQCSERGVRPKEVEIAADVFEKGSEFDPNQDSFVRVYVHNLRQKLEKYYASHSAAGEVRLSIPRGEYRLAVVEADESAGEGGFAPRHPSGLRQSSPCSWSTSSSFLP